MTRLRQTFTTCLLLILLGLLSPFAVAGQTRQYTVATGEYILDLPPVWRAITVSGAEYPRDFRFSKDKSVVRLQIRREIVKDEDVSTTDVAERQRRLDRSSKRGYVTGTVEDFN